MITSKTQRIYNQFASEYYPGDPCLAILTPVSCMIQWVKTHSPDAADWHIDCQLYNVRLN